MKLSDRIRSGLACITAGYAWEWLDRQADDVAALEADNARLREALRRLVERIDYNGGIGEYRGGPAFVMVAARAALEQKP